MDVFIDELGKKAESDFFDSFNWGNFEFGDIVHLEDCDEVQANGAYVSWKQGTGVSLIVLTDDDLHQVMGP